MEEINIFGFTISAWLLIPLIYFFWVTFFLILKRIGFRAIRKFTTATKTKLDDIFIAALDFPLMLLIFPGNC